MNDGHVDFQYPPPIIHKWLDLILDGWAFLPVVPEWGLALSRDELHVSAPYKGRDKP